MDQTAYYDETVRWVVSSASSVARARTVLPQCHHQPEANYEKLLLLRPSHGVGHHKQRHVAADIQGLRTRFHLRCQSHTAGSRHYRSNAKKVERRY